MRKQIIFVSGMHRSGTSLIAKAVHSLGAELGDNLMPAAAGNNPKGFWEDLDVNRLNDRILEELGLSWDTPTVFPLHRVEEKRFEGFVADARRLLRNKLAAASLFALKDPRICMLVRVWVEAAQAEGLAVGFVIAFRNPLDVAASLIKRDGFEKDKALNLWRNHGLMLLQDLARYEFPKIVVDYDAILAEPEKELRRLSVLVQEDISWESRKGSIREFVDEFIDAGLRHSSAGDEDVDIEGRRISGLAPIFEAFRRFAASEWSDEGALSTLSQVDLCACEIENFGSQRRYSRNYSDALLEQQAHKLGTEYQRLLQEKENAHTTRRDHELKDLAARMAYEMRVLSERKDSEMERLRDLQDKEREEFHRNFEKQAATNNENRQRELRGQADAFERELQRVRSEHEQEVSAQQAVYYEQLEDVKRERAAYQENLEEAKRERIAFQGQFDEVMRERATIITALEGKDYEVAVLRRSLSWRLTAPLRRVPLALSSIKRSFGLHRPLSLLTLSGVKELGEKEWKSTSSDPALLVVLPSGGLSAGWYRIEATGEGLVAPEVFLDFGDDFTSEECYRLERSGERFLLEMRFPQVVFRMRFDPRSSEGDFHIQDFRIRRRSRVAMLSKTVWAIYRRERAAGNGLRHIFAEKWRIAREIGVLESIRNFDRYTPELANEGSEASELNYSQWIETVEAAYLERLRGSSSLASEYSHLFLVLVDDPSMAGLGETIESVRAQTENSEIRLLAPKAARNSLAARWPELTQEDFDAKVGIFIHPEDQEFDAVTLVQQGWMVAPDFCLAVNNELAGDPPKDFVIYPDHDILTNTGERKEPAFKPEWSPDYLLEHDYIGGVLTLAPSMLAEPLKEIPSAESIPWVIASAIASGRMNASPMHVPFVLTHRTEYAQEIEQNDRLAWLRRLCGARGTAEPGVTKDLCRIRYALPEETPRVTIVIPTRDRVDLLERCITTLRDLTEYSNYQIVVVDNGSEEEETQAYLQRARDEFGVEVLEYSHPFNFSAINNFGVSKSEGELICFLNNDIEIIESDWLSELVGRLSQPGVGCVGAKLLYPNGVVQHGGVVVGFGGVAAHAFTGYRADAPGYGHRLSSVQNYSAVTAACLLTRRDLFEELGGLNERFLAVAFNDIDYCLRVREIGLRVVWTPHARLIHHESASRAPETERMAEFAEEIRFMRARWGRFIEDDPAYSPHLSLKGTSFSISDRWLMSASHSGQYTDSSPRDPMYGFESNLDRIRAVVKGQHVLPVKTVTDRGLTIIILNLNKPDLIGPQLEGLIEAKTSLQAKAGLILQIIIGDTGSTEDAVWSIYERHAEDIEVETGMTYHFSRCNNMLFEKRARYPYVLFLNNDVFFSEPSQQLLKFFEVAEQEETVGSLGTRLMYPDGRLQHGGVDIFREGDLKGLCYHPGHGAGSGGEVKTIGSLEAFPAVTGACLLMKSELFAKCGGFDEEYQAEAQDVDLCLKARRFGKSAAVVELGEVIHFENATRPKGEANMHDRARFVRKWSRFTEAVL